MKKFFKIPLGLLVAAFAIFSFSSCQKNAQFPARESSSGFVSNSAFTSNQAIVIAASSTDTIYIVGMCRPGQRADTVGFSSLPDTIGKYLTDNYSGYTFKAAFKILGPRSTTLQGYVVEITYNSNPVGLVFNASGIFVQVLEQKEAVDMHGGPGWHEGGCFGNRDGRHIDTIALSALPGAITTYFKSNYPSDTLKHALVNRDSSYDVVSVDNGVFVSEFTENGGFIKRVQIYPHVVTRTTLTEATLPANISSYLTTTYPAYVFDAGYTVKLNGTTQGYLVFIDANMTKYLVRFDAGGTFVKAVAIR